jgi:hypothetical protein
MGRTNPEIAVVLDRQPWTCAFLKNSAGREEYCIAASMPRKLIGVRTQLIESQFCQLFN